MHIGLRDVGGQTLRVGIRPGDKACPPLLLFNGIGANIELAEPFIEALDGPETIIFDVPWGGRLACTQAEPRAAGHHGRLHCPSATTAAKSSSITGA